jgi:hypothetical protein
VSWLTCGVILVVAAGAAASTGAEQLVVYTVRFADHPPFDQRLYRSVVEYSPSSGYREIWYAELGALGLEITGTAITPSGRLVGVDAVNRRLVEIDTTSGLATPLVTLDLDLPYGGDLAVDGDGQGWLVAPGTTSPNPIYRVDLATGRTELVGDAGIVGGFVQGLTWLRGTLYAVDGNLYAVDPATAQATLIWEAHLGGWGSSWMVGAGTDFLELWCVVWELVGPVQSYDYGTLDPTTGELHPVGGWGSNSPPAPQLAMIEVVRIGGASSPIPALGPVGVAVLVLALGAAGVVQLRSFAV